MTAMLTMGNDPDRRQPVELKGKIYTPPQGRQWKTDMDGMKRLREAERLLAHGRTLKYIRYLDDYPLNQLSNVWNDTWAAGFTESKVYAVQTSTRVVERCILMTTDPGDLVLDPTCGSGTTARSSEKVVRPWCLLLVSGKFIIAVKLGNRDGCLAASLRKGIHMQTTMMMNPHILEKRYYANGAET